MTDRNTLLDLYRTMLRIRLCEESFVPRILDGTLRCPVHLYSGEEAVAAGVCSALTIDDYVLGTHRSHGHFLAKGGSLRELVSEVYCRETGCSRGRGGSMHLLDPKVGMLGAAPIVAGTIALALGAALASSIRRDRRVTVSFFGDGATGEGVLFEALNVAAIRKLPLIFVCENNLYSTHMPIGEIRVEGRIASAAEPFGVPSLTIDGNDVQAVREAAIEAVSRARRGDGPTFVECLTYRMRGHVGPNDNVQGTLTDIRPPAEIEAWQARDPIDRLEHRLVAAGHASAEELAGVRSELDREIADAHAFAAASPFPDESSFERYVFND